MYTVYNTGDIVFFKLDGTVATVWTYDGLYSNEYRMALSNFITRAIVHTVRHTIITINRVLKM